jgi:pimeloyl-ACP methyl ester carboxylesterase
LSVPSVRVLVTCVLLGSRWLSAQASPTTSAASVAPAFVLPSPTGRNVVGTTRLVVDGTTTRPLVVTVWYPASSGADGRATAPYLREESALRTMADWGGNPGPMLLRNVNVRTHAFVDAPIVRRAIPVILFSHGYLDQPSSYTALMEELASHGYAVFSVAHTGETMAVTLPNGRISSIFRAEGGLDAIPAAVTSEWVAEDSVSAVITAATDATVAEATLRTYLASIPTVNTSLSRWVADLDRVLTHVSQLNAPRSGSSFSERLDLTRVAAIGHSMGGVASAAFCARDGRCRAAINLDGSPQYGQLIDQPSRTPFLMVYGSRAGRVGVSDLVYDKGSEYWRAVVQGALHLNFGDWMYWPADSPAASSLGSLDAASCTTIVHRLVREFLAMTLHQAPAPLFAGGESLPSLSLTQRSGRRRR